MPLACFSFRIAAFRHALITALIAVALASLARAHAQGAQGDTSLFAPLSPSHSTSYRLPDGHPGSAYWQNRADYDIRATLDTTTKTLHGTLTLHYTNHSPVALGYVWFQLEQNAFRTNSLSALLVGQDARFGVSGFQDGIELERIEQHLPGGLLRGSRRVALHASTAATMVRVPLAEPLHPGATATLETAWHFAVPVHGADRMGRDGALYEIAQWYPRVAVYDDVRGWNTDPYLGQGEFYLEYGDFTYAVTVPAGYIVAGTGMLQNSQDVLTATERQRMALAAHSDTTVHIVTAPELREGSARPTRTGMLTWHFAARNVRDVAWAASPDYEWDASSWKGILTQAYYRRTATDPWSDAADQARMSIQEYSERWFSYPYPQISAVEGPVSGMEYPMLAMEARGQTKRDLYDVVTHEIGHNWFPMVVGSNERLHAWMDEGFNTFINAFATTRRFPDVHPEAKDRATVEQALHDGFRFPIEVPPDRVPPQWLGFTQYTKPSVGLHLLREEILGPAVFDSAFRTYVARWAYKHPTPSDFFHTMEDVSGTRLDWFWREWFLEGATFDQGIDTVSVVHQGGDSILVLGIGNHARGVLPILLRITYTDGSKQDYEFPAAVWSTNERQWVHGFVLGSKAVRQVELDPDRRLIDVNRHNNVRSLP